MLCLSNLFISKRNGFFDVVRWIHKTHYEVLNLNKDCTTKEIKAAFISLTKKYHPDKNKDSNSHDKYVKIIEAYNVLSKPSTRTDYDLGLQYNYNSPNRANVVRNQQHYWNERDVDRVNRYGARERMYYQYYNETLNREKSYSYRRSNRNHMPSFQKRWIVIACFVVMGVGAYIQYLGIMESQRQSEENAALLLKLESKGQRLSKERRLKQVLQRHAAALALKNPTPQKRHQTPTSISAPDSYV